MGYYSDYHMNHPDDDKKVANIEWVLKILDSLKNPINVVSLSNERGENSNIYFDKIPVGTYLCSGGGHIFTRRSGATINYEFIASSITRSVTPGYPDLLFLNGFITNLRVNTAASSLTTSICCLPNQTLDSIVRLSVLIN
jgi:hypothetical protein